jgi:ankyrin repeat protein
MPADFAAAAAAVSSADAALLDELLGAAPELKDARAPDGASLLLLACRAATDDAALAGAQPRERRLAVVETLLGAGADPGLADQRGCAPLHLAAMANQVPLCARLLEAGAPRAGRLLGCDGGSPLALALFYARSHSAELLADAPEPFNLRNAAALGLSLEPFLAGSEVLPSALVGLDFYRPLEVFPVWERTLARQEVLDEALSWAARNSQLDAMEQLVALGADVNANAYRGTALLWACFDDRVDAASWLLDHGADPNLAHDFGGRNHGTDACALHLAAQFECLECARLLVERGASLSAVDGAFGATPLGWARHEGSAAAVAMLESLGAP